LVLIGSKAIETHNRQSYESCFSSTIGRNFCWDVKKILKGINKWVPSQMTSKCGKNKRVAHKLFGEFVTNVLATFWRLLWSVTEQTHGNMESICFTCLHISGNSKVTQFVYWRLDICTETAHWSLLFWIAGMDMECLLKNLASIFQSLYPSFYKVKPKMNHRLLFLQKDGWCQSPKFQSNVFGSSKG